MRGSKFKQKRQMEKSPAAHRDDIVDQDEEMRKLIDLFSNGRNDNDQHQNTAKSALRSGTNYDALPPPSSFVRRRKISYAVPVGPSLVQAEVDMEPTACIVSSTDPHDEYGTVLNFLMGLRDRPSE